MREFESAASDLGMHARRVGRDCFLSMTHRPTLWPIYFYVDATLCYFILRLFSIEY